MTPILRLEHYGLPEMDARILNSTNGGCNCGIHTALGAIEWGFTLLGALADGASESAHSMPGLK